MLFILSSLFALVMLTPCCAHAAQSLSQDNLQSTDSNLVLQKAKLIACTPTAKRGTGCLLYTLPGHGDVKLYLLDDQGELLTTLLDNERATGSHELFFNSTVLTGDSCFAVLEFAGTKSGIRITMVE